MSPEGSERGGFRNQNNELEKHTYSHVEALSYFSAPQLFVHLVHVSSEPTQSFCPLQLCVTERPLPLFVTVIILILLILKVV